MFNELKAEDLQKHLRTIAAGESLFKQGERGNSLQVILSGTIVLHLKTHQGQRRIGTVGAGETLGEKALLDETPYRRTYTAVAQTEVKLLELDRATLKVIQERVPDFSLKVLRRVTERLDEANALITILMLKDECERLTHYLLHFCEHHCKKSARGVEISITLDEIHDAVNIDKTVIQTCLKLLEDQKILQKSEAGYLVTDENALISFLPSLQERLAA